MDRMAAVRDLGTRELFRLRAYDLSEDTLRFAVNEAVVKAQLTEEEERVFRESLQVAEVLLGAPAEARQLELLSA